MLSAGGPIGEIEKAFGDRVQARIAIDAMLLCDAIVAKGDAARPRRGRSPSRRCTPARSRATTMRRRSATRPRARRARSCTRCCSTRTRRRRPEDDGRRSGRSTSTSVDAESSSRTPASCRRSSCSRRATNARQGDRRAPGDHRRAPAHPGRRSLRGPADRARRRRRRHRRRLSDQARAARAARPRASPSRAIARSSSRSSTRTARRARRCSIRTSAPHTTASSRAASSSQVPPAIDTELQLPHRRRADGEEAVGAGDRHAQDRDRALAGRGRLPRGARLGGVERGRAREQQRPTTPRAIT